MTNNWYSRMIMKLNRNFSERRAAINDDKWLTMKLPQETARFFRHWKKWKKVGFVGYGQFWKFVGDKIVSHGVPELYDYCALHLAALVEHEGRFCGTWISTQYQAGWVFRWFIGLLFRCPCQSDGSISKINSNRCFSKLNKFLLSLEI